MHWQRLWQKPPAHCSTSAQPGGHWTGKLSSSALSTATAVCALAIYRRHAREPVGRDERP